MWSLFWLLLFVLGDVAGGREVFHFVCGVERLQVLLQGDSYRVVTLFRIARACLNKYPSLREKVIMIPKILLCWDYHLTHTANLTYRQKDSFSSCSLQTEKAAKLAVSKCFKPPFLKIIF